MKQPVARHCVSSDLSQLTQVALADVEVHRVSALHDFRLQAGASLNSPVYALMPTNRNAAEMRARWGVKVKLAFSMGARYGVDSATPVRG